MSADEPVDQTHARLKHEGARERELREQFSALFAEWLENRAEIMKPGADGWGTLKEMAHSHREDELARQITTFPVVYPYMIFRKFEVLEYYMGALMGTAYTDNREIVMLAGIKADLWRFEPAAPDGN